MSLSDHIGPEWRHRLYIAYLIAMAVVFLTPMPETGIESRYIDKIVHAVLFFGFALVYFFDHRVTPGRTILLSSLFAGGIELAQWILPFREAEFADFVAGSAGAALAAVVLLVIGRRTTNETAG